MMILDLHRQGVSVSAISRQCGLDRKTLRRYIERRLEPRVTARGYRGRRFWPPSQPTCASGSPLTRASRVLGCCESCVIAAMQGDILW